MPARLISLPFVVLGIFFLYLTWEYDENYALYIIAPVIVVAILTIFSPQINWWWYSKYPPKLDATVADLVRQHVPYYINLSLENKKKFRDRLALFTIGNEFMPQGMEGVPEDIKAMVAIEAVKLTFGYKQFLFPQFEKVVIYPKPFPSPQYPQNYHASEIFIEDGVLLCAMQQIGKAFFEPKHYLSLPLYEYAKIFKLQYPNEPYPQFDDSIWDSLQDISGYSKAAIQQWINLPVEYIDVHAIAVHHFFTFSGNFKRLQPAVFEQFVTVFRQNPTMVINPTQV